MQEHSPKTDKTQGFSRVLLVSSVLQLGVFTLACLLLGSLSGGVAAKSALLGGLIAFLPALYFGLKTLLFKPKASTAEEQARQIVRSFYRSETGKLLLSGALFALAFAKVQPINAAALFAVFFCTLLVGSFAPLLLNRQGAGKPPQAAAQLFFKP